MLIVGTDKTPFLEHLPANFLLIDDGPLIDALTFPKRKKITRFDHRTHSFNPIKNIAYQQARQFITTLDAIFPEGENTLTHKNSNFAMLNALLSKRRSLEHLIPVPDDPKDTGALDAYQKIQTLLLSPVLERVLNRPTNFSFKGTLLARLNRAELGDFDCFVLGSLLMAQYQGHVLVPDFGFYGTKAHVALIRQNRLTAGVNFLDEVPLQLRQHLLLMDEKVPSHATFDDAETLAVHSGLSRGTNAFVDYVHKAMG